MLTPSPYLLKILESLTSTVACPRRVIGESLIPFNSSYQLHVLCHTHSNTVRLCPCKYTVMCINSNLFLLQCVFRGLSSFTNTLSIFVDIAAYVNRHFSHMIVSRGRICDIVGTHFCGDVVSSILTEVGVVEKREHPFIPFEILAFEEKARRDKDPSRSMCTCYYCYCWCYSYYSHCALSRRLAISSQPYL